MVKKELQYDIDAFLQYTFLQGESSDLTFVEGHRLRLDYLRTAQKIGDQSWLGLDYFRRVQAKPRHIAQPWLNPSLGMNE